MIGSKKELVLDPMTGEKGTVYFDTPTFNFDEITNNVSFILCLFTKSTIKDEKGENQDIFAEIRRVPAVYKMSTFLKLMKGVSFDEYPSKKNQLMIQQISYNSKNFWNLKASDLQEIA